MLKDSQPSSCSWLGRLSSSERRESEYLWLWHSRKAERVFLGTVAFFKITDTWAGLGGCCTAFSVPVPVFEASMKLYTNGVTRRKVRSLRACFIRDRGKRQEGSVRVLYMDPGIFL